MAKKKIIVLRPLWGKFKMPHRPDQEISIDSKLADEMIGSGYAADAKEVQAKAKAEAEAKK